MNPKAFAIWLVCLIGAAIVTGATIGALKGPRRPDRPPEKTPEEIARDGQR